MANLTAYISFMDVASDIRQSDTFNELINELAENNYDYVGQSDEELTEEGKAFILKLAEQIKGMEEVSE